ncbi:GNAT family N-acetyltransferase [Dinoroseobacter sp. PD6]|uniref:GNAT family N-acetyltransferase n=1 Tax=Dinoroseobacter sp. PD6 TaxID=3028384 RepID=UPI00237BA14D|nr:GNAT family N-acyltransferase [Dinoroseobacter sp. PD6]MDD9715457.1 GNAT family N-acetyltransferase [Dinoroseobacter sp. PD6]
MPRLTKGRYAARLAESPADIAACQRLRGLAFHGPDAPPDADAFDAACLHVMVTDIGDGALVGCFRLLPLATGAEIARSYSAQFYELSALREFDKPMVELGRFCLHPDRHDPDILRVAWGAMTAYVDAHGVGMLFGCSSFQGTDGELYRDAFALLTERHLAPSRWLPRVKSPRVFPFAQGLARVKPDLKRAMRAMPPLLRTYLLMGGWVSDHAVVDREMNTLHVFTGLEIGAIPPARARLLRATAAA